MRNVMRLSFVLLFAVVGLTQAITIEWVTDNIDATHDQPWIDLLTSQGYTVNAVNQTYRDALTDSAKLAALNAADLVIISRVTNSGSYDGGETPLWNGLTSPVLCLHGFLPRNSKWKWLNADQNEANAIMQVLDPSHPFFMGVPLDANNQVDVVDFGVVSVINTTNPGNSTVLATRASDQAIWLATWDTGEEYYPGSGQVAGGPRVMCGLGQNATPACYNITEAGKILFLNIVYEMSGATWNRKPLLSAGPDRIAYLGDTVALAGSAVDPEQTALTVAWTQVSGPAAASIADASAAATTATFSAVGTYVLQLEASDGDLSNSDTLTVYVKDHAGDVMLAHWTFDSLPDPNTLIDMTGNGFDGVFYNTDLKPDPNVVAGHITGSTTAGDLGGNSYWEIPTSYNATEPNFNDVATGVTIAAWVNIVDSPDYCCPMIVGNGANGWRFQVNNNRWNFTYQAGGIDLFGTYPSYDGFWHHVVAVYDGVNAKAKIYVDGVLNVEQDVTSGTLLDKGTNYPLVQVGNRGDATRIWTGQIDDVAVYTYPLSDAEIASLAQAGDRQLFITAGTDQTVQYKGEPVPMAAELIVSDDIPAPTTLMWEVVSVPLGADPAKVVFSDNTALNPDVTFPTVSGTYTLRLTADDTTRQVYDDVAIVILIPTCGDVLTDGLKLGFDVSGPEGTPDCYVDLYDLAVLSTQWLSCNNPADENCEFPY